MSSQRYQRVAAEDTHERHGTSQSPTAIPNSPPPSFRSHVSSRRPSRDEAQRSEEERSLEDAFEPPSDDDDDDEENDDARDRRRLMPDNDPASPSEQVAGTRPRPPDRSATQIPMFTPAAPSGRMVGNSQVNDGVFANLNAKPRAGEDVEEKPPTYEQAAADATPPYWETTILSPYAHSGNPDDIFVDGLLVGSFFSFIWNCLISMSFQPLIGFLLTYLLHTTHAAKHGSRAGLGISIIQYGFGMRYSAAVNNPAGVPEPNKSVDGVPDHPNSHNFDPSQVTGDSGGAAGAGFSSAEWLAYGLMILGWFILIRAITDFLRARRQEALIRSSPDRGLGVAVVAENESPETSV